MEKKISFIAELVGGRLVGNADDLVDSVNSLGDATHNQVSFLGNKKYIGQVATSEAGLIIVPESYSGTQPLSSSFLYVDNPSLAFSKVIDLFAPPKVVFESGIHHTAVVAEDALIHSSAHIGPHVVIESGVHIGENSVVCAGSYIGHYSKLGSDCYLHPNVTIRERCILGNQVSIHSGTVIGSDGFGYEPGANGHTKIPQVGNVVIDDEVEIGANCTIDRARFGKTHIKQGAKLDNLVHVAHNVVIGKYCFIVAQVGIAGSTIIGDRVIAAGQAGFSGHLNIGDGAFIMGQAGVSKDLQEGDVVIGSPAVSKKEFAAQALLSRKLERLEREIALLKK